MQAGIIFLHLHGSITISQLNRYVEIDFLQSGQRNHLDDILFDKQMRPALPVGPRPLPIFRLPENLQKQITILRLGAAMDNTFALVAIFHIPIRTFDTFGPGRNSYFVAH